MKSVSTSNIIKQLGICISAIIILLGIIVWVMPSATASSWVFPDGLEEIEAEAFANTPVDGEIIIPDGTQFIGEKAFWGTSISKVVLPDSIVSIAPEAFANNHNLLEVVASEMLMSRLDIESIFADTGWLNNHAHIINIGDNIISPEIGWKVQYTFTASSAGLYVFHSDTPANCTLYDSNTDVQWLSFGCVHGEIVLPAGGKAILEIEFCDTITDSAILNVQCWENVTPGQALQSGKNSIELGAGEIALCEFIAEQSGEYCFCTYGDILTEGYVFSEDMTSMMASKYLTEQDNINIIYPLIAGQKVLFGLQNQKNYSSGPVDILVLGPATFGNGPVLHGGLNEIQVLTEQTVLCEYTANQNGSYSFYTNGSNDTFGYLYDSDMNRLSFNNNDGEENNFCITYELSAGQKVYVGVRNISGIENRTVSLTVIESSEITGPALQLGSNSVEIDSGQMVLCSFTAPQDGNFNFYSRINSIAKLYDSNMNVTAISFDGVYMECTLCAGETVFIGVKYEKVYEEGKFILQVQDKTM